MGYLEEWISCLLILSIVLSFVGEPRLSNAPSTHSRKLPDEKDVQSWYSSLCFGLHSKYEASSARWRIQRCGVVHHDAAFAIGGLCFPIVHIHQFLLGGWRLFGGRILGWLYVDEPCQLSARWSDRTAKQKRPFWIIETCSFVVFFFSSDGLQWWKQWWKSASWREIGARPGKSALLRAAGNLCLKSSYRYGRTRSNSRSGWDGQPSMKKVEMEYIHIYLVQWTSSL